MRQKLPLMVVLAAVAALLLPAAVAVGAPAAVTGRVTSEERDRPHGRRRRSW